MIVVPGPGAGAPAPGQLLPVHKVTDFNPNPNDNAQPRPCLGHTDFKSVSSCLQSKFRVLLVEIQNNFNFKFQVETTFFTFKLIDLMPFRGRDWRHTSTSHKCLVRPWPSGCAQHGAEDSEPRRESRERIKDGRHGRAL